MATERNDISTFPGIVHLIGYGDDIGRGHGNAIPVCVSVGRRQDVHTEVVEIIDLCSPNLIAGLINLSIPLYVIHSGIVRMDQRQNYISRNFMDYRMDQRVPSVLRMSEDGGKAHT